MRSWFSRLLLLCAVVAAGPAIGAAPAPFKTLYDSHEWFKLRDAVATAVNAPLLYRGAVACAFHDLRAAERDLRRVAEAAPRSEDAIEARGLLITVAQMQGDYRGALGEVSALRAILAKEDAKGLENGAAFFSLLAPLPRQNVSRRHGTTVHFDIRDGNLFVPVAINGKPGSSIVDTGANFSVIAEGDARQLGLAIHEAPGSQGIDASGTLVPFRLAVAERLSVGGFEIRNVTFLVARDDQEPFVNLPSGTRSVIGLPVLLAFETLRWQEDGRFDVGFPSRHHAERDANLCFDGADVHVLGEHQGKPVDVFLDTGATKTRLMPPFARDFPETVRTGKRDVSTIRGVGGSTKVNVAVLERLLIRVGGHDLVLDSPEALLSNLAGRPARFHVWAGLDLFRHVRAVTIDFHSMRLDVE